MFDTKKGKKLVTVKDCDMNIINNQTGWIEVICGSMFSGKTEELIKRINRATYAKQKIQAFKPALDDRYDKDYIVSHSKLKALSKPILEASEILDLVDDDTEIVAIDEAQFFSEDIILVCNTLADSGKRVIVAGLDQDYRGIPFGHMPYLMAIAEYVTKSLAICVKCGNPANRTQRLVHEDKTILVGATDIYEARCRNCHEVLD